MSIAPLLLVVRFVFCRMVRRGRGLARPTPATPATQRRSQRARARPTPATPAAQRSQRARTKATPAVENGTGAGLSNSLVSLEQLAAQVTEKVTTAVRGTIEQVVQQQLAQLVAKDGPSVGRQNSSAGSIAAIGEHALQPTRAPSTWTPSNPSGGLYPTGASSGGNS